MTNLNLLKTLTSGFVLSLAILPHAWADVAIPCGQQTGDNSSNCWSCGNDCSARLDTNGKLSIYGSGEMTNYWYQGATNNHQIADVSTTAPWKSQVQNIYSIEVNGVSKIGDGSFCGLENVINVKIGDSVTEIGAIAINTMSNLKHLIIPPSVTTVNNGTFGRNNLETLLIPSSMINFNSSWWADADVIYCTSTQMARCGDKGVLYEKQDNQYIVYDKQGNIVAVFENYEDFGKVTNLGLDKKTFAYDLDGNYLLTNAEGFVEKYDKNEKFIASFKYSSDGSIYIYDENRKLIGAKKSTAFTPAEAAALVRKGNNNTVTLTFK